LEDRTQIADFHRHINGLWGDGGGRLGLVGRNLLALPALGALPPEVARLWLGPRHVLGVRGLAAAGRARGVDAVGAWGVGRPFSEAARAAAGRLGVPYVALEDGFVRSLRPGVAGETGVSLVADPVGIYYDATRPSHLERLIADAASGEAGLLDRARRLVALLRARRVSKYNHAPDAAPEGLGDGVAVVVDQRAGDVSVRRSAASADAFAAMLALAVEEHGRPHVVVKTHPDAVLGGRGSYLTEAARAAGVRVVAESVNPWAVLDRARAVYTVSSLLGFEALMAGVPVTCFGLPFYAGWGLTRDRLACPRRAGRVPLEQVVAAAYLRYTRYVDRGAGTPTEVETVVCQLAEARDAALAAVPLPVAATPGAGARG
jgi:capsular polysaccharide export protein